MKKYDFKFIFLNQILRKNEKSSVNNVSNSSFC